MHKFWGIAAAVAMTAAASLAVVPTASAAPCGYYTAPSAGVEWAYYNHCGSGNVTIRVDAVWPRADYDTCVGPGSTPLKYNASHVNNAWYIGNC